MSVPQIREFAAVAPAALNVAVIAVDVISGIADIILTQPNMILDIVNDPDLAAGINHTVAILKNGIDTGLRFPTVSMSPASAGRMAVGPIAMGPGRYQVAITQTLGALSARTVAIKFTKRVS